MRNQQQPWLLPPLVHSSPLTIAYTPKPLRSIVPTPKIQRAMSQPVISPQSLAVIEDFVKKYEADRDRWRKIAESVRNACEREMEEKNIQAVCTYRAKTVKSLKAKVLKENKKRAEDRAKGVPGAKEFESVDEIYKTFKDFAGVRIALYSPSESRTVDEIIPSKFIVTLKTDHIGHKGKPVADTALSQSAINKRKFTGYVAQHYVVNVTEQWRELGLEADAANKNISKEKYFPTKAACTEIQVVSLILHMWSEIEHDIIYKSGDVKPSPNDIGNLDALNGLVETGERIIEVVYSSRAMTVHEAKPKEEFKKTYNLEVFLLYKQASFKTPVNAEPIKVLFEFLKPFDMLSPAALAPVLKKIDEQDIADSIPNRCMTEDGFKNDASISIMLWTLQQQLGKPPLTQGFKEEQNLIKVMLGKGDYLGSSIGRVLKKDYADPTTRLRILLSSLVWIVDLFGWRDNFRPFWKKTYSQLSDEVSDGWDWIGESGSCLEILKGTTPISSDESVHVNALWGWFLGRLIGKASIFSLTFGIALLGVQRKCNEHSFELDRLRLFCE